LLPAAGLGLAILLAPVAAVAQGGGGTARWSFSGLNELTVEHFEVDGDANASPFRFPGTFVTDRLTLNVERASLGRKLVVGIEVLAADNPYFAHDGVVAQLLRFELEDGTTAMPYRIAGGDVIVDLSRRVLQSNVKGASFELQPQSSAVDQSILVVSGSGARSWDDAFQDNGDSLYYHGASYLLAAPSGNAMLVANYLNTRQSVLTGGAEDTIAADNNIGSLYGESRIAGFLLEGEVAFLGAELAAEDVSDRSFYAQLSRNGGPLAWRLRYEDNGADYRPAGAVGILADRRIGELHARYMLGRRGTLRGRLQWIETEYESDDPRRADLFGLSYDGRLIRRRPTLQVRLSSDVNRGRSETGLFDQLYTGFGIDLRDRFAGDIELAYRFGYRDTDDRTGGGFSRSYTDHSLTVGRPFSLSIRGESVRLGVEGGLTYRRQTQANGFDSVSPVIDVSASSRRHRFALHLSFLEQDFALATVGDLSYQTQRLTYSFTHDRHLFAFELGQELRRPSMREKTDSLRAAFRYRLSFGGMP
jgi:hypothetical protein